jgi:hypothetical protein
MKLINYILIFFVAVVFIGCAKEEVTETDTEVGHSKVTFFPLLSLKGATHMAVPVGGTFTDPGSTATEAGAPITATVSGTVNTSTPGVYRLTYTATNKDGFSVSTNRFVAVYSTPDATAAANDLSGSYLRAATNELAIWTKLAPGVYKVVNPGGATAGRTLAIIVFNSTGYTIKAPVQIATDGNTSSTSSENYTPVPAGYTWVFNNPGYGTGVRTFVKQ